MVVGEVAVAVVGEVVEWRVEREEELEAVMEAVIEAAEAVEAEVELEVRVRVGRPLSELTWIFFMAWDLRLALRLESLLCLPRDFDLSLDLLFDFDLDFDLDFGLEEEERDRREW